MAVISKGWLMLLTMELILSGEPDGCVKSPDTVGKDLRLGETPEFPLRFPVEDLFRRPRFFPSCACAWPQSSRALMGRGLCLLEGDCFTCPEVAKASGLFPAALLTPL